MSGGDAIHSKLDLILSKVTTIESDVAILKEDVAILKTDVAILKEDVAILKEDVSGLKVDVAILKEDVSGLKVDVAVLKKDMSGVKIRIYKLESQSRKFESYIQRDSNIQEYSTTHTIYKIFDEKNPTYQFQVLNGFKFFYDMLDGKRNAEFDGAIWMTNMPKNVT